MSIITRQLGLTDYKTTLQAMQAFTASRTHQTPDEIWLTEHAAVYTLGLNRKNVRLPETIENSHTIPVVLVDRGGKITYHGHGQAVIYLLVDLKRRNLNVRQLVNLIEASIIELLAQFNVTAITKADAPGVYVQHDGKDKKIASLGLRLKNNCCYHGLSLNVEMDLAPFSAIDPCGYVGLEVTQTKDLGIAKTCQQLGEDLLNRLQEKLAL
jgi:lipoyl(octanoyl) transferase